MDYQALLDWMDLAEKLKCIQDIRGPAAGDAKV